MQLVVTRPGQVGRLLFPRALVEDTLARAGRDGVSYEALVIDNDMLGVVQRTLRGIEVSDETLAVDIIREVALGGPGHFLGHTDTLAKMETEYLYPAIADRQSPDMWRQAGSCDIQESARQRVRQVLSSHYPQYIDPGIDAEIRSRFPIQLAPEAMRAGNGRWAG